MRAQVTMDPTPQMPTPCLCDPGDMAAPLCASVSSSEKWSRPTHVQVSKEPHSGSGGWGCPVQFYVY